VLVIDKTVYELYKEPLTEYFAHYSVELTLLVINATESNKNWETAEEILHFFEVNKLLRRETVIGIGGGVLLDIVGFAASLYRRGIQYIKVPTTLLAIVDASVGAKVGINHFERRNRLGAYYPPIASFIDRKFINTQTEREIKNGMSEMFKLAVIKDKELFDIMYQTADQLLTEKFQRGAVPVRAINLAISGMIEELSPNLWEKKLDRCVDFGHSFSPLIEMKNLSNMSHGEAVLLDCIFSSCLAFVIKLITVEQLNTIVDAARKLGLQIYHDDFTNITLLESALRDTSLHRNANQYLPMPVGIGEYVIINNVTTDDIIKAIEVYKGL
jgi:3-dehydroquinate synthase